MTTLNEIEESLAIMHTEALRAHNLSDTLVLKIAAAVKAVRELNRCDGCGHHRLSCICHEFEIDLPDGLDPDEQYAQDSTEQDLLMGRPE